MPPASPGALAGACAEATYISAVSTQGADPECTENSTSACAQSSADGLPNWTSNTGFLTEGTELPDENSALPICETSPICSYFFVFVESYTVRDLGTPLSLAS